MNKVRLAAVLCTLTCIGLPYTRAQLAIAQWDFNSIVPDGSTATGSILPSLGSGSASTFGGVTGSFAAGSPRDPAGADNTAWSLGGWPALAAASGTAGVQFMVSTLGASSPLQVSFDLRQSATASERFQLQATADGASFSNVSGGFASFGVVGNNVGTSFDSSGLYINSVAASNQAFVQKITYTFSAASLYQNNANFGFRLVSVFDGSQYDAAGPASTYSGSGTLRIDLVTVSKIQAVPEPAVSAGWIGALAIFAWAFSRYQRRQPTIG